MSSGSKQKAAVSPMMAALAAWLAASPRRPLPAQVVEKTKHHLLDTLAAMVSGSRLLPGQRAIAFVEPLGGTPEACVIGTPIVTTAINAAMANGMLGHADETDDSHAPSLTHPGCGIVPAALAIGERNRVSGRALLRAIAVGYDLSSRLTMSLDAYQFREDGHSTHSFGPMFGAAAASGSLLRFDARRMRHLLSYTAQQASGVSCWMRDPDHVEKAFDFGGMPARNGVYAALMVDSGMTGVEDVFSGERNFFVAYGRKPRPQELVRRLGVTYEIMNTNIKRWSVGSPIQAPLDSLLTLITGNGVRAEDVERVDVRVAHQGANTVDNREMPDICLQHLVAVMLIDGTVSFASSHDLARMRDPKVLALRRHVTLAGDDALTRVMPSRQGIVSITLKNGTRLTHHTKAVRGTAQNPMTRAEVDTKCFDLLAPILGKRRARRLCDTVWTIDRLDDVRSLRPMLRTV
jgi:2-methylcitrate dehydratase PrpD